MNFSINNFSHNAGVNYANRNATQHTPVSKFATGYLSAVTVSVSIAVGIIQKAYFYFLDCFLFALRLVLQCLFVELNHFHQH